MEEETRSSKAIRGRKRRKNDIRQERQTEKEREEIRKGGMKD